MKYFFKNNNNKGNVLQLYVEKCKEKKYINNNSLLLYHMFLFNELVLFVLKGKKIETETNLLSTNDGCSRLTS